mgnify:CR=1 FL=1
MNEQKLLITVPSQLCGDMKYFLDESAASVVHAPLESFTYTTEKLASNLLRDNLHSFAFVVYGNVLQATYFEQWISENDLLDDIRNLVHFTLDQPTSDFLELHGIPAIQPRENARPIDILEFMLRISREGKTLYPSCANRAEEMPGLLEELEMEVAEFTVCEEVGLTQDELETLRDTVAQADINAVLFHNRSAVTRAFAAFPDLNFKKMEIYSGSAGVTEHLISKGIELNYEAGGSWHSIEELIREKYLA